MAQGLTAKRKWAVPEYYAYKDFAQVKYVGGGPGPDAST